MAGRSTLRAAAEQDPHFGHVTDVMLRHGVGNRPVWAVTVAGVRADETHTYQVDAITSGVMHSSVHAPSPQMSTSAPAP